MAQLNITVDIDISHDLFTLSGQDKAFSRFFRNNLAPSF